MLCDQQEIRLYGDTPLERAALAEILPYCHQEKFSWQLPDILRTLENPRGLLFYLRDSEAGRRWLGFTFSELSPFTCDLLYIFVRPEARGKGLGPALLRQLLAHLQGVERIEKMFLEVRISNDLAKSLYEGVGMRRIGRRPRYYNDGEDAEIYEYLFSR